MHTWGSNLESQAESSVVASPLPPNTQTSHWMCVPGVSGNPIPWHVFFSEKNYLWFYVLTRSYLSVIRITPACRIAHRYFPQLGFFFFFLIIILKRKGTGKKIPIIGKKRANIPNRILVSYGSVLLSMNNSFMFLQGTSLHISLQSFFFSSPSNSKHWCLCHVGFQICFTDWLLGLEVPFLDSEHRLNENFGGKKIRGKF